MDRPQPSARRDDAAPQTLLASRSIAWLVFVMIIVQFAIQGGFLLSHRRAANRTLDAELRTRARAVATALESGMAAPLAADVASLHAAEPPPGQFEVVVVQVFDRSGRAILDSRGPGVVWDQLGLPAIPPDAAPVEVRLTARGSTVDGQAQHLARAVVQGYTAADGSRFAIVVASSDRSLRAHLAAIGEPAAWSAAAGALVAILGLWMIKRRNCPRDARSGSDAGLRAMASSSPVSGGDPQSAELARLAQELESARRELQDGLVERERFLSNVSHEIKTPIAVLMIEAQTVDRSNCSEGMLRFVETVEGEMIRLGRLVESFLLLTRVQSGRGPATLKCYSLNDMVVDSIESCGPSARQHQVTLRPTLLAHDATVDAGVVGDPDLLRTLVENLLRNSIRFSPPGSAIDVVASVDGETAGITVADQGPGIPPDRLKTIFDRFANTQESQRQGRGHGLGLAVAKGIAELHGGTIQAFNREGSGCEFVVRLRLAHSAAG